MTIMIREPRESERVLKLELFWAIRDFSRNSILAKQEVIQYVLNILFFIPIGFLSVEGSFKICGLYSNDFIVFY